MALKDEMPIHVSLVPQEHVLDAWGYVKTYIDRAVEHTDGRYATEDVLALVVKHGYLLWVALGEGGMLGACVTGITTYPRRRVLAVLFLGGTDGLKWKQSIFETLSRFARDQECDCIEASGRGGWERYLRDVGYKPLWYTFELPLEPLPEAAAARELEHSGG